MEHLRAFCERGEGAEPGSPMTFIASTGGIKRDGLDLEPSRWFLENYARNPVVLWSHDYWGERLPIGRGAVSMEVDRLMVDIEFDQEDEFARLIEGKYRRGYLNAVSVGWDVIEHEGGRRYDLLDISAVPVPGDPDALMERQREGLRSLQRQIDTVLYHEPPPEEAPPQSPPRSAGGREEEAPQGRGEEEDAAGLGEGEPEGEARSVPVAGELEDAELGLGGPGDGGGVGEPDGAARTEKLEGIRKQLEGINHE